MRLLQPGCGVRFADEVGQFNSITEAEFGAAPVDVAFHGAHRKRDAARPNPRGGYQPGGGRTRVTSMHDDRRQSGHCVGAGRRNM